MKIINESMIPKMFLLILVLLIPMNIYGQITATLPIQTASPAIEPLPAGTLLSVDNIIGNLRYIPPSGPDGFTQGSPDNEPCSEMNESPAFLHMLTRRIAVMETEVTRAMWWDLQACQSLPDDPTNDSYGASGDHPVQNLTWYEAVLFANLLSIDSGFNCCYYANSTFTQIIDETNYVSNSIYWKTDADGYRLPTEGEWEYFCRAGSSGPFNCEEDSYNESTCGAPYCENGVFPVLEESCVFCANSTGESDPVAGKLANSWNLVDTHGNVSEWCWDRYSETYPQGIRTDRKGPIYDLCRVARGGSWQVPAKGCRSAARSYCFPGDRSYSNGFRLVRTLPEYYASEIQINFDDDAAPCLFASTMALREKYMNLGVQFDSPQIKNGGGILDECGNFYVTGQSSPNFLAFNTGASYHGGGVPEGPQIIRFSYPVRKISMNVGHRNTGLVTIECYDGQDNFIGQRSILANANLRSLWFSGYDIAKCVITFTQNVLVLDDLVINY